jgi:K+-sensing histidine kinase KdpD
MKKFWIKKAIMFFLIFVAAVMAFGFVVMGLWNAILPTVLGVKTIWLFTSPWNTLAE